MKPQSGCYLLIISLLRGQSIAVGRLGVFEFLAGFYIYTGSAMGGLQSRIARHLRSEKNKHWHIDYLLEYATIDRVIRIPTTEWLECALNARVSSLPGAIEIVPRFGSSDCRCPTHLYYFNTLPGEISEILMCRLHFDG